MTAPRRLAPSLRSSFLLGLDSSAPAAPAPSPRPTRHRHPPAPSPPHYTAHQPLRGPEARVGSGFLRSRFPATPHPCAHSPFQTKLTSHLAAPCPCCVPTLRGGDIADWALGLGSLLLPRSFLWLPTKGPGRASPGLKRGPCPISF